MKTIISNRGILAVICFCLLEFGQLTAMTQTSNSCVSPLNADFVTKYEIIEAAVYTETNSSGPVPASINSYGFDAIIKLATNLDGTATTAVVTLPGGQPMLMKTQGPTEFIVGAATNAFTNITSSFPNGTYQFLIFNDTISVTLPADAALPNAPALSNYAAAQSIDAGKDFALSWEPFITGGAVDFINVTLVSETNGATVFSSDSFGCPGALDGNATSILIPANTMASNTTYRVGIEFVKVYTFDTNSVPNSALLAGTEAETSAIISTASATVAASAPVLGNAALLPGGSVRFDVTTTPGLAYTVQFNTNLANPLGWTPLLTNTATGAVLTFTNSPSTGGAAGFYRVSQQ
jgi:hypothetical protein